jgi:hypothetical protein
MTRIDKATVFGSLSLSLSLRKKSKSVKVLSHDFRIGTNMHCYLGDSLEGIMLN